MGEPHAGTTTIFWDELDPGGYQCSFTLAVDGSLVGHYLFHADAAVLAELAMGDRTLVQQLDEEGALDIQNLGGPHRAAFRILGHQGDAAAVSHRFEDVHQQGNRPGREFQWVLLFGIGDA